MKRSSTPPDTTAGGWPIAIIRALNARGLDGWAMAREAGIDVEAIQQRDGRSPVTANTRLWRLAVSATGDQCFGLEVHPHVPYQGFGGYLQSMMMADVVKDSYQRLVRLYRASTTAGELRLDEFDMSYRITMTTSDEMAAEDVDVTFTYIVAGPRFMHADPTIAPLAVRLKRGEPDCAQRFHDFFRVTVAFGQTSNEVDLPREMVERPVPAGQGEVASRLEDLVNAYLARVDPRHTTHRIRPIIVAHLARGEVSATHVAREIGMSVRSLQRRLSDEGTSFVEVVEEVRERLARVYLADRRRTVSEVAYLLGFADVAAFSRAFKRWTGMTPTDFARRPD